jgi:hypothetical protein
MVLSCLVLVLVEQMPETERGEGASYIVSIEEYISASAALIARTG